MEPDSSYARALGSLARAHDQLGEYEKAARLYDQAIEKTAEALGGNHRDLAHARYERAELRRVTGDPHGAERELRSLIDSETKLGRSDEPLFGFLLNNLGLTLIDLGQAKEAEGLVARALELRTRLFGRDSEFVAKSLLALASARAAQLDLSGRSLVERARVILLATNGPKHTETIFASLNLFPYLLDEDPSAAYALAKETFDSVEGLPTEIRDQLAGAAFTWSQALAHSGQIDEALQVSLEAMTRENRRFVAAFRATSYRGAAAQAHRMRGNAFLILEYVLAAKDTTLERLTNAYQLVLWRKGIETRAYRLRKDVDRMTPTGAEAMIRDLRAEIAQHERRALHRPPAPAERHDLESLKQRLERLERDLHADLTPELIEAQVFGVKPSDVLHQLGAERALLDIVLVGWGSTSPRYAAFFLSLGGDQPVQLFEIGSVAEVDRMDAQKLGQALFGPIESTLRRVKRLWVSAEGGLLNRAFEALPFRDRELIDQCSVSYLFRAADLIAAESIQRTGSAPIVFGNPDFDAVPAGSARPAHRREAPPVYAWLKSFGLFEPLNDGAEAEAREVAALLGVGAHTGAEVTKAALLDVSSPEILHLSTHGFAQPRGESNSALRHPISDLARIDDPLQRSGLALSGANACLIEGDAFRGADYGLLWGSDILDMDLRRTDLAVITACHSAAGEVRVGDGAHSLARAFYAAGANSVVGSLGLIPDEETRALIVSFYRGLQQGLGRMEALHLAKLELRKVSPNHQAWAGVVLYGSSGPLQRKRLPLRIPAVGASKLQEGSQEVPSSDVPHADPANIEDLSARIDAPGTAPWRRIGDLYERAGLFRKSGRFTDALADYDRILRVSGLTYRELIGALADRANTLLAGGDLQGAVKGFTAALEDHRIRPREKVWLLNNRAEAYRLLGALPSSRADREAVLDIEQASMDQRIMAIYALVQLCLIEEKHGEAVGRLTDLLEMKLSEKQRWSVLWERAKARQLAGDPAGAQEDANLLLADPALPPDFTDKVRAVLSSGALLASNDRTTFSSL